VRKNDERNPRTGRGTGENTSQKQGYLTAFKKLSKRFFSKISLFLKVITDFCNINTDIGIECDHGVNTLFHKISCVFLQKMEKGYVSANRSDIATSSGRTVSCLSKNKSKTMNTLVNTLDKAAALYQVVLMCHFKSTAPMRYVHMSRKGNVAKNFCCNKKKSDLTHQQKFLTKPNRETCLLGDQAYLFNSFDQSIADESWDSEEGKKLIVRMRYLLTEEGKDGFSLSDKAILRSGKQMSEIYGSYKFEPGELESFTPISYDPEEDNFIVNE
jgi:hypothetical protein